VQTIYILSISVGINQSVCASFYCHERAKRSGSGAREREELDERMRETRENRSTKRVEENESRCRCDDQIPSKILLASRGRAITMQFAACMLLHRRLISFYVQEVRLLDNRVCWDTTQLMRKRDRPRPRLFDDFHSPLTAPFPKHCYVSSKIRICQRSSHCWWRVVFDVPEKKRQNRFILFFFFSTLSFIPLSSVFPLLLTP